MFYLRESEASAANVLSVAKAKRQLQSAQSERKSITRYANKLFLEKVNNKKKNIGIYSLIYNFQI